jgi:hypothetical protein
MVLKAQAVVDPWTMVVHFEYTSVADLAMVSPCRFNVFADCAISAPELF